MARRAKPVKTEEAPELITFTDGSGLPYCAAVFIRWKVVDTDPGPWSEGYDRRAKCESHLLTAKSRVTQIASISNPELR